LKGQSWAIVLLNLGGPDSLNSVKPFLYNLFCDKDIIPLGPGLIQKLLAWLISIIRAPKTRKTYELIGGKSPILDITLKQASLLKQALTKAAVEAEVFVAMRYWHPFIEETLRNVKERGYNKVLALPLYPQFSKATTGSSLSEFYKWCKKLNLRCKHVQHWFDNPLYIKALSEIIKATLKSMHPEGTCLLFSAHGLPEKFIQEGDPYKKQVEKTVEMVLEEIKKEIPLPEMVQIAYQSRVGPTKWIEPYTDEVIRKCALRDFKRIVIVPISFVSDHVETLYEIDILYAELSRNCGIELYRTDTLNTNPLFIEALKDIVLSYID